MVYSLSSFFEGSISKFFWAIQQGIFYIIKIIVQAFEFIAGMPVEDYENSDNVNFLNQLFSDPVKKTYAFILFISLGVMMMCIIVGLIKAQYNKEQPQASKKVLINSLKSLVFFATVPLICLVFIEFVSLIMNAIVNGTSATLLGNQNSGLGESINQSIFDVARKNFIVEDIVWSSSYNSSTMSLFGKNNYNYVLGILVSCVILYALLLATINIVERLINLVLLYISAPMVIATSSLDEGARFNIWKDKILSKYLGIMGNILSMIIYLYISKKAKEVLGTPSGFDYRSFAYICIVIGGAFVCSKGNVIIAGLISHNEATQEGLSQSQSNGMLRGGMALGGAVLGGAERKARKMGLGSNSSSGGSSGGGSGDGGASLSTKALGGGKLAGLGSKFKGGLSAVRTGGLLAVAKGVGKLANPFTYINAFKKDDNAFKQAIGQKITPDSMGLNFTPRENKRLDKMAEKENRMRINEDNFKKGESVLEHRINSLRVNSSNKLQKE